MTKNERIKTIIEYLKKGKKVRNQRDFAERIGGNYSSVSEIVSGKRNASERFIRTICSAFPELSYEWMSEGEGNMIVEPESGDKAAELGKLIESNVSLAASVAKLVETNSRLVDVVLTRINKNTGPTESLEPGVSPFVAGPGLEPGTS